MKYRDFITVKNLAVKTIAGNDAWQRPIAQPLRLSLRINVGPRLKLMSNTDDLRRTLNYDSLSTNVVKHIEAAEFPNGIEEVARQAAETIGSYTAPHEWVTVSVSQPRAHLQAASKEVVVSTAVEERGRIVEKLHSLSVASIIGVNDLERVHKQNIVMDFEVTRAPDAQTFTQEFIDTVIDAVAQSSFLTLESFANFVAGIVSKQDIIEAKVSASKPSALNLADSACIEVVRKRNEPDYLPVSTPTRVAYIAFGTNQGDTTANIFRAVEELRSRGVRVDNTSAIYKSEPLYYTDQPQFLNGVFRCYTELDPEALLRALKEIEYQAFSRVKHFDNGPRTMDLDIILYDNVLLDAPDLTIPHRDMLNRSFVLLPLRDVMPNCPFPVPSGSSEATVVPLARAGPRALLLDPVNGRLPTAVMAIMNATPDSFSDGGDLKHESADRVTQKALEHIANGASLLDIGGYSTRPGAAVVSEQEEIRRVVSTVEAVRKVDKEVAISVDTFRSGVAEAALGAGADIINDVFSGALDPRIFDVAAAAGAPLILNHARGDPSTMRALANYPAGLIDEVALELRKAIDAALEAGCKSWQLILDPGLGFAKSPAQDVELVRRFGELKRAPALTDGLPLLPWLVGPSRKSFIGSVVGEPEPKRRVPGTLAVVTAVVQQGADIVRVHDSKEVVQAVRVADAIYR